MVSQFFTTENTQHERIRITHYTAEEVHQHFQALYESLDFKAELNELNIMWYDLKRKKKAVREFKVLSIALWGLALQRSFPEEATFFFDSFRKNAPFLNAGTDESAYLQTRLNIYIDLLQDKKDTDFLPVASYLAEILALNAEDMARLRLKVSLLTRALYNIIFERLF